MRRYSLDVYGCLAKPEAAEKFGRLEFIRDGQNGRSGAEREDGRVKARRNGEIIGREICDELVGRAKIAIYGDAITQRLWKTLDDQLSRAGIMGAVFRRVRQRVV